MRARSAEVPVDDDDRDEDGEDVHDERKQQVLGDERDVVGRRRQDLGDEQQEHNERQQYGNAHGYLLTGVRRQVEHGATTGENQSHTMSRCVIHTHR